MNNAPLITVVGPTASGKSAFAMWLAQQYDGEIICADSRTVYKGLDIGTAKPTQNDQARVPHHLLDLAAPGQPFSAAQFKEHALKAIQDIHSRGKLPIMVGGTGLYVDAVIFDYKFGPPADAALRARLQSMDVVELQNRCIKNNIQLPINKQNKLHLIRAIELGGLRQDSKNLRPNTLVVGITTTKDDLTKRIQTRAHQMLKDGIVQEVSKLGKTYGWSDQALTGNIYSIFRHVVEGTKTVEDALDECVYRDLHLAKRQLTWLKRNSFIQWGTPEDLKPIVRNFLIHIGYIGN